ncbi:hypothetical protein UlMin_018963, partial [Ulmus minor]
MGVLGSLCQVNPSPIPTTTTTTSSSASSTTPLKGFLTRRRVLYYWISQAFLCRIAIVKDSPVEVILSEEQDFKVEGTGSVYLVDAEDNGFYREGKIVGCDLAVLKVNVEGYELKHVVLGTSRNLHVGQSCFAIGNPYGYENTLTTGVVSGLGREIPSPNGCGAIQTDAAIN